MSSFYLQHYYSPNSSINTNANTAQGVYTNTSLLSLKLFNFSLTPLLNPSPNSKTTSTSSELPKEFPKTPKTFTIADSNSNALPEELLKNVKVLTCESTAPSGACRVCLVGTTHGSQESCGQVQEIINLLKPQGYKCEFRVAHEEANKCGARVMLGDCPIMTTFSRLVKKDVILESQEISIFKDVILSLQIWPWKKGA